MTNEGWIFLISFWSVLLVSLAWSYKIILSQPEDSMARGLLESEVHHHTSDFLPGSIMESPADGVDPTPGDGEMPPMI